MTARAADLFDELALTRPLLDDAYGLASRFNLALYDGVYLALAARRGVELVTADLRLVAAAGSAGMSAHVRALA